MSTETAAATETTSVTQPTASATKSKNSRDRNYIFTVQNYTDDDELTIYGLIEHCTYVVVGRETAPSTGTRHYQGFICFANARTFSGVLELLPAGAHIEPKSKFSTFEQASNYCKKDGDFFEYGVLPMDQERKGDAGKLSSEERWQLAKSGQFELLPPEHYPRYRAIFSEFRVVQDRPTLDNQWICGHSGCGKSKFVRTQYGAGTELGGTLGFYTKPMNKWWDNYRDQNVVVLEDFDPRHGVFMAYFLKIWTDHYAFNGEIKNGTILIRPKKFIVTSQYAIEDCFTEPEDVEALNRRFEIVQFGELKKKSKYADHFNPPNHN